MEIRLREKLTCSAAINEELGCDCEELEEAGESGVCFTVREREMEAGRALRVDGRLSRIN